MANFTSRFNTGKQEWETPQKLFDILHKEFNFKFDLLTIVVFGRHIGLTKFSSLHI